MALDSEGSYRIEGKLFEIGGGGIEMYTRKLADEVQRYKGR